MKSDILDEQDGEFKNNRLINYITRTIGVPKALGRNAILKFKEYISFFASDNISKLLDSREENLATLWESVIERKTMPSRPQIKSTEIEDLQKLKELIDEAKHLVQSLENDEARDELISLLERTEVSK